VVKSKVRLAAKVRHLGEGIRAVPRLCVLQPGIRLTNDEKITHKYSVTVAEKCQLAPLVMSTWRLLKVASTSLSLPVPLEALCEIWVSVSAELPK